MEQRITSVGYYWDRKGNNGIDLIVPNDIGRAAIVAEVKRNADNYNRALLEKKFETIRNECGKYHEVSFTGLSMTDM